MCLRSPDSGTLVLTTNVAGSEQVSVPLTGRGTSNSCPLAVAEASVVGTDSWGVYPDIEGCLTTTPLKTIKLRADRSSDPDGSVVAYRWIVLERPQDSTSRLDPDESIASPTLFLDLIGRYVIELQVTDHRGLPSCRNARVVVLAESDEDIHIQLVWDTPADPDQTDHGFGSGADLDLHLLHPLGEWFNQPYDCFFYEALRRQLPTEDCFWDVARITWPGGEIQEIDEVEVAPNNRGRE